MKHIGIDVAKDTLDVYCDKSSFIINNNRSGYRQLMKRLQAGDVVGLEPTNTYHYAVSNFLLSKGITVKLINSLVSYRYQKITMRKQTNDKSAAKALSELLVIGKGRILTKAEVDNPLREITRARHRLVTNRSSIKTKLNKETNKFLCSVYKKLSKDFDKQIEKLEMKISSFRPAGFDILLGIPGISDLSAHIILAEIGDINRFSSYRQIVSFAGFDPSLMKSGTSINKQGGLSKRGSPYLRHILYLNVFSNLCARTNVFNTYYYKKKEEGKHHYSAMTATARKMLQIIYALLKKQEVFSAK